MSDPRGADQVFTKTYDPGSNSSRVLSVGTPLVLPSSTDSFTVSRPDSVTVVYQFRTGGISGAIVATWTLVYTDSSQSNLLSGALVIL